MLQTSFLERQFLVLNDTRLDHKFSIGCNRKEQIVQKVSLMLIFLIAYEGSDPPLKNFSMP